MRVIVNGEAPIEWAEFLSLNQLSDNEAIEIRATLDERGFYEGGGGAQAEFTVEVAPPLPPFYTVAVYKADRAYGGPEEGGWYYECGERIDDLRECAFAQPVIFGNQLEAEAIAFCQSINKRLEETINKDRREISSVLSEGRYVARLCEGYPETHYPKERPRYE